jgi:NAD(P)H-dependent FMN reductase
MIHASKVLVIVGSVRAKRICPQIAAWVAEIGRESTSAEIELLDLKDWPLPMDDEPGVPAAHPYENEHTRAFGRKIAEATAFVFVTPQYNWGYPAPLKNALDHLYKEWSGKPAMIVTYGTRGGGKCAAQLRQVLKGLHMKPVAATALKLSRDRIEANFGNIDAACAFATHERDLRRGFAQLQAALVGGRARKGLWRWSPTRR